LPSLNRPDLAASLGIGSDWFQLQYSPEGGYVRLTVPMATRKDIPGRERFDRQLAVLDTLSNENRDIQEERSGDR
jgi:hypothetical protein